jgi:hypothetical protein
MNMFALAASTTPIPSDHSSLYSSVRYMGNSTTSARLTRTAAPRSRFQLQSPLWVVYDDVDRPAALLRGVKGKRLLYRQPDAQAQEAGGAKTALAGWFALRPAPLGD